MPLQSTISSSNRINLRELSTYLAYIFTNAKIMSFLLYKIDPRPAMQI